MAQKLESGKIWVVASLIFNARKLGITVANPQFELLDDDQNKGQHTLCFNVRGSSLKSKFNDEDLQMCPDDFETQARLNHDVRLLVRSLRSTETKKEAT